jgi:hypothetical protein
MNWRAYLLLALMGLLVVGLVAALQSTPGYMDADYYYATGMQLVEGHGFTEPFLWNYLDDPNGLPHPSHAYWMPLASLMVAVGALIFGPGSWLASRVGFLLVASLLPPLTAAVAWSFTSRRDLSLTSGLLAIFPAFYLVFLPTTDTFGLYMLFGGLFFLVLGRKTSRLNPFLLGLLAGAMHLTRADGLLWLLIAIFSVVYIYPVNSQHRVLAIIQSLFLTLLGYLLVMTPWFIRNHSVFGALLAPGGSRMLWLTTYDQLFAYPASQITSAAWWQSGLEAMLRIRTWALGVNLANALSVQWEVFLVPLVGLGLWYLRKDRRIHVVVVAWSLTLIAMTVAFPFAGARGGYFHSGAAVQTIWWVLAPIGLERIIAFGNRKRGWVINQAGRLFRFSMIIMTVALTIILIYGRVIKGSSGRGWSQEETAYRQMSNLLIVNGMSSGDVVMVANPPGFFLASGNPAIALPDGDLQTLNTVAERYKAKFAILEDGSTPAGLVDVYNHPVNQANLTYLGRAFGAQFYAFIH